MSNNDKASLLTASGMLLHAFPSMFVSLLHATSWIRQLLTANFLSYDIESTIQGAFIGYEIKTINIFFNNGI